MLFLNSWISYSFTKWSSISLGTSLLRTYFIFLSILVPKSVKFCNFWFFQTSNKTRWLIDIVSFFFCSSLIKSISFSFTSLIKSFRSINLLFEKERPNLPPTLNFGLPHFAYLLFPKIYHPFSAEKSINFYFYVTKGLSLIIPLFPLPSWRL